MHVVVAAFELSLSEETLDGAVGEVGISVLEVWKHAVVLVAIHVVSAVGLVVFLLLPLGDELVAALRSAVVDSDVGWGQVVQNEVAALLVVFEVGVHLTHQIDCVVLPPCLEFESSELWVVRSW